MDINSKLTNEEIITKILNKEIKLRHLSILGEKRATEIRLKFLEKKLNSEFTNINLSILNPEKCKPNIENMVGSTQIPLGIAGPILINFENKSKEYYLPLATTEGALVASVNRGCSVINKSGGCETILLKNFQTRSILFKVKSINKIKKFLFFVNENLDELKKIGNSTDKFIELLDIEPYVVGLNIWLRIKANTNDAMGMNMVTIAGKKIADYILNNFSDVKFVSESGNLCVDKKPSSMNLINSRGKKVIASVNISNGVINKILKTTANELVDLNYRKNLLGSAASGSIGYNAHFANIIAAIYIATGQDPAHTVSGSIGFTTVEKIRNGVNFSVTLPSIQVATIGGGTSLPTQKEALSIMNVETSVELSRVVASAVLAGEISLLGALCSKELTSAHEKHNR
ncbi:hydroxymethylglutaryl-CoA reductase [archaeon]|jgi:hydroxymethylglutaryl-CoA reductase (NADPH)|nr:hydroxymethylglutaryl-CoA reductase [archaeon]MBT4022773.1 hydroxymethylglutaryl-CoA reductase [archaeon]MBT4273033.1 hydroxymethylglutaryl-CoA reductase [archaeon]MBT4461014.1 hydroxymethylglutaryl-CoA reductase [archaeon]MBT4858092.1 hydroxymethylglutaryl-CoA reductase [archaeon]